MYIYSTMYEFEIQKNPLSMSNFILDQSETFKNILPILIKMTKKNLEIEWV